MSSRLIDVLPVTLGSYLVLLGGVLLLDSTGVRHLGPWDIVAAAFGLALVAMGVLSILAALRVRRFSRRLRRTVGHVEGGWGMRVQDGVISTVFGDITLDLASAGLPEGETELTLLCWLGAVTVLVPADAGLDVTAQSLLGSVRVLDRREEGLVNDVHVLSEDFDARARRLRMRLSTLVGEVTVVASHGRPRGSAG
jgi:cell wall-active antibiotic response 4TMS protein YvqF